jgi:putative FmdB family regulatory protein
MPLYEFTCDVCGHRFEVIRKFSDPPVEICPKCGGTVQKVISAPAFQLKGTGWYVTDYAKKEAAGSGKNDGASKDAEGGTGAKADQAEKTVAEKGAAPEKSERSDTAERSAKNDRSENRDRSGKGEGSAKSDKGEKAVKPAATSSPAGSSGGDTGSSSTGKPS